VFDEGKSENWGSARFKSTGCPCYPSLVVLVNNSAAKANPAIDEHISYNPHVICFAQVCGIVLNYFEVVSARER
jgi:hypothetical protein